MSGRALRLAVKKAIQERLILTDAEIDVTDGPEPHPSAGKIFVAVHPGPWTELSSLEGHYSDHSHGVNVTTSVRSGEIPNDRWGKEVIQASADGLEMWAEEILAVLHNAWAIVTAANEILESSTDEFAEPLRFQRAEEPKRQMAGWWGANLEQQYTRDKNIKNPTPFMPRPLGFSQTLVFQGARRTRFVAEQGWP